MSDHPLDSRHCDLKVGDEVVYLALHEVKDFYYDGKLHITLPRMVVSKITEITFGPGTGFAECGTPIHIALADGTILHGESENGGYGCLKLEQK